MDLTAYLAGPFPSIKGWCGPGVWQSVAAVVAFQAERNIDGPVAEIGVYHGKFFIGLTAAKGHPEGNTAIDVFAGKTSKADRNAFERNLAECGVAAGVDIRQVDSSTLRASDFEAVRARSGGFSLFSVDGAHQVENTLGDLRLAMALTAPGGVVFVDDYLNADWPGVGEAVARLYLLDAPIFVPFAYCENKLLLCHVRHHRDYVAWVETYLREHHADTVINKVRRFGYKTLTIHPVSGPS